MNKKGQGLPMNTVVMAILVIVVLILVITFFFGGFSSLSLKIREVFFGSLAGTGVTLAKQQCSQYCNQLQWTDTEDGSGTTYCKPRAIDTDEDGKADSNMNCLGLNVDCSYIGKNGQAITVGCKTEGEAVNEPITSK